MFKRLALGDIAAQLAVRLLHRPVRLNSRASCIDPSTVTNRRNRLPRAQSHRQQPEAEKLLLQLSIPEKKAKRSTVCLYFTTDSALVQDPVLLLNRSAKGIVNNMFFTTKVAPLYASAGKMLVSVSPVGSFACREDAELAGEVVCEPGGWFGTGEVASWTHLRTYRIGFAQPDQTPPTAPAGRDPRVVNGMYMCGDHWCSATFDGAMVSGRRAAEALAKDRGL